MKHQIFLGTLALVVCTAGTAAIDEAKLEARKRARDKSMQTAGIDRVMSKETPEAVKALPVFGTIEWTLKEMPLIEKGPSGGVSGAGFVVVDGSLYLMGGFIPAGDETTDASRRTSRWTFRYDPATDRWTRLPDLPARLEYTRAVAVGPRIYVLGGGAQLSPWVPSAEVFCLDVSQEPLRWQTLPPMSVARSHLSVDAAGSRLVAAGGNKYDAKLKGYGPQTIQGVTELFDLAAPEQGWRKGAPLPGSPRGWCATAALKGKFYLFGGVTWTEKARLKIQETLCYDAGQDQWSRRADPPIPISGWEGDVFRDRYIVLVGGVSARWNDIPFVYDTETDRWMKCAGALQPGGFYNDPGVCIIGETIYVAGGEGPGGSHFNHFLVGRIRSL